MAWSATDSTSAAAGGGFHPLRALENDFAEAEQVIQTDLQGPIDTTERVSPAPNDPALPKIPTPADAHKNTAADIGWANKENVITPGPDVTKTFGSLYAKAAAGQNVLPSDATQYVYVMIPGFGHETVSDYMQPNAAALRAQGCDVRFADVHGFNDVPTNTAAVVALMREIAAEGKQMVLYGHSEGGINAADAVSEHPELRPYVHALVTQQSPEDGDPVANDLIQSVLDPVLAPVFRDLFNGDPKVANSLGYDARRREILANPYPSDVPTLTLSSTNTSVLSAFDATDAYVKLSYGLSSDGIVLPVDTYLPAAAHVQLTGNDHMSTVSKSLLFRGKYKPELIGPVLMRMALDQARGKN